MSQQIAAAEIQAEPDDAGLSPFINSVVVNCVEHNHVAVAGECLWQAAHYVEVSVTAQILAQIETLQAEAARGQATVVVRSIGVACDSFLLFPLG